jgi:opacity protein-like surface antigen
MYFTSGGQMNYFILTISLLLFLKTTLLAKKPFDSKNIDFKLEIGSLEASFAGTMKDATSSTDFNKDLGYTSSKVSYFSFQARFKKMNIPTIVFTFVDFSQNENATLNNKSIIEQDYNESVRSTINYKALNMFLYREFKTKGSYVVFFNEAYYTGDIEVDLGMNIKNITYSFYINSNVVTKEETLNVDTNIYMPYAALKYYRYYFTFFANISDVSFSDIKSKSYNIGIEYQIMKNISVGLSYTYEDFEEKVKNDKVNFETSGNMFSVKYNF